MSKPKVFISYSHADEKRWKNRLQKHLKVLERHGSLSFWDDRRIAAGQEWRAEIKTALDSADAAILLISPDFLGSNFINDEEVPVILQRRISDGMKVFPLIVRSCPWQKVPWLEPLQARPTDGKPLAQFRGDDVDRILSELVSEIEALLNQPQPKTPAATETQTPMAVPPADECPYLGLEAFTEDKEHLFFGRDDFADALFTKVKRQSFVALVGPSGCGKSSVVQAGLFPRLRQDTQMWETILFPPREDPFLSLAAGFVWRWQPQANFVVNTNEAKKLAAEMKDSQRMIEAVHCTVAAPDGRLLLVVDQFEEMFTLCDEGDRRAFLGALLEVKDAAPVTILLTLRADFMGQAQSFSSAFSQLLDESMVSHRPLTRADLEAVITGPARHSRLEFESGLVSSILQEVAAQPDSLPLLEYALKEMWRKRHSRVMGHALYEAVGKVEGAIGQHADAVLHALPEAEQSLALRALTRLVRVASEEDEADTRLRLPLSELSEVERAVLQSFVTARLLVTKRKEGAGADTIEVAHEAMIRRWVKLREALDSDREFLMWRRQLASRRKAWEQKGRDNEWLLYGGERNDAQHWLKERSAELTYAEIEFITWDDRPDFQIERILSNGPGLLPFSGDETRKNWFTTLVFCREEEKALSAAREIEATEGRAETLRSVAEAMMKARMAPEALSAAREIEGADCRAQALSSIAEAMIKAGTTTEAREATTEALTIAFKIEDKYSRAYVLSAIAETMGKVGIAPEAGKAATGALSAAREIEDPNYRAYVLSLIAKPLVEAGMAVEALAAARESENTYLRAYVLCAIAEALVTAGMATEAREATAEALVATYEVDTVDYRAQVCSLIAVVLVKMGMATEAREATTEALAAIHVIETAANRERVLSSIAKALVEAGMAARALDAARAIEDSHYRERALISIAEAMRKAGKAAEALAAAREIETANSRAWALSSIAKAMAKAGMESEAHEAVSEALAAAREIEAAENRALALLAVADYWLEQKETDEARTLLEEAQAATSKVFDDNERSDVMRRLAVILARLQSYRAARETAEQCSSSEDRLAAYTAILREYHIEREPSLAQLFAEEEEGEG